MRFRSILPAALLSVAVAGVAFSATACSSTTERQTQVVAGAAAEGTGTISPLERGQIRRDVLKSARLGMEAWKKNDVAGMKPYFGPDMMAFYSKLYPRYAKEGKVRVRKYTDISPLDMVDLDSQARQALVTWNFYDDSYYASTSGGKLTQPTHTKLSLQLTMQKDGGKWRIVRLIGDDKMLQ